MLAVQMYDVVLWVHIVAVVVAFGGVFSYPVWFAVASRAAPTQRAFFHEAQARVGKTVISPGLLVILLAGAYMATDRDLWSEPWVTVPLVILIVVGGLGGGYLGPREERLAELARSGDVGPAYEAEFRRVRTVSYLLMALIVIAIYFMTAKPFA
ncbi:MAG TPA: DUF2269 family protein [Capillimicrobium sp.]|jgi:uncharacterized membrane protein